MKYAALPERCFDILGDSEKVEKVGIENEEETVMNKFKSMAFLSTIFNHFSTAVSTSTTPVNNLS
jgi:hypothetical protein